MEAVRAWRVQCYEGFCTKSPWVLPVSTLWHNQRPKLNAGHQTMADLQKEESEVGI